MAGKLTGTWRVLLIVLVLFVAVRLTLPYILTRHVTKVLSELEGYRGQFHDVDVNLYRGAYQIDSLRIFKTEGNREIPFIEIPVADFSIEWAALLKGSLVGHITFENPTLNFIAGAKDQPADRAITEQNGSNVNWGESVQNLMRLDVNRLSVHEGRITFLDLSTRPNVNLFLYNVEVDALNLTNAKDNPEKLPSRLYLQALSIGNGQLNLAMRLNLLKQQPDLDLDLRFENVDMKAFNDFFQAYAGAAMENGTFTLYSEMSLTEGKITGHLKPLFNDLHTTSSNDSSSRQTTQLAWVSMAGILADVFDGQRKEQFETMIAVKGEVAAPEASVIPELWRVFGASFLDAFERRTSDKTSARARTSIDRVGAPEAEVKKDKKELRREKRKEKREQRRRAKKDRKKEESENARKSASPGAGEG